MPGNCPFCGAPLPGRAPYDRHPRLGHRIVIQCPRANCGREVMCNTLGDEIVGPVQPGYISRLQTSLRHGQRNWKHDIAELIQEACKSNYLYSSRGAAICLRLAMENTVNIHLLGNNPERPNTFERGRDALVATELPGDSEERKRMEFIKLLGDSAAHSKLESERIDPLPSQVDRGLQKMEELLELVGVV